jgi:galactokinase
MTASTTIAQRFSAKFGATPRVFRAPGRVNLIGEHTDYNDGFVMPAAIGFYCFAAVAPRGDRKLVICSEEFRDQIEVDLDSLIASARPSRLWSDYPLGVALQLEQSGFRLSGANLMIHGEVPMGAGLSSSASIEVATALALATISGHTVGRIELARICQQAESEFVGMKCGIMDQFISLHGRRNQALMLDCRSLDFALVSVPESVRLVICNTGVKHQLASGEYNRRRADSEEAVAALKTAMPQIRALRDVSAEQLERHRRLLPPVAYKRAVHVVRENERVLQGAAALRFSDLSAFGQCMAASHVSLRDLYEVSCRELDVMVGIANQQPSCYGARMTGGGFGGATINFVDAQRAENFSATVAAEYRKATGISPDIYTCTPVDGADELSSPESPR